METTTKNATALRATLRNTIPDMLTRQQNARARFVDVVIERTDCSPEIAEAVLAYYLKLRAVKLDCVNGSFNVKHGALLDVEVLRRAIEFVTE